MAEGSWEVSLVTGGIDGILIVGDVIVNIIHPPPLQPPKKSLRQWLIQAITAVLGAFILAVIAEGPGAEVYQMLKELIGRCLGFW